MFLSKGSVGRMLNVMVRARMYCVNGSIFVLLEWDDAFGQHLR